MMPMMAKTMFGSHTASIAFMLPLTAKVVDNVRKRIKIKLSTNPNPMCSPMPPRVLREARDTPMSVSMNDANGVALRL